MSRAPGSPHPAERTAPGDAYVLDTAYTWGFYEGQSPTVMSYAARLNGIDAPDVQRPFRYLELGCGNGVTTNVLAAAFPHGEFHAVDLNPAHVESARRTAELGGLGNVEFRECPFRELIDADLPPMDFVTLHGVYSWVSEEVRRDIRGVLDRHLRPGGLAYVSYNALPGWAALGPIRQIMLSYTGRMKGTSLEKAKEGLRYLRFLRENGAAYFEQNPESGRLLDTLLAADRPYVAHEYFNASWQPQYFSEVASEMAEAGLTYCGTTRIPRNYLNLCVPEAFQPLLLTAVQDFVRETHKSLILNERFRCDVYCKDARFVPAGERPALFRDLLCTSTVPRDEVKREVVVSDVSVSYSGEVYDALVEALAAGDRTVGELQALPELRRYSLGYLVEGVTNLIAGGQFQVLASRTPPGHDVPLEDFRIATGVSRALLRSRLLDDRVCYLASPVLGSGMRAELLPGLLLLAADEVGQAGAVERAAGLLDDAQRALQVGGRPLTDRDERRAVLARELDAMGGRALPLLRKLGVIEPREAWGRAHADAGGPAAPEASPRGAR